MEKALRKQLREEAKNHKIIMGVLAVKNTDSGKLYIKGGLNLEALVNKLRFSLNSGSYSNRPLQQDWNQKGETVFVFEYLHIVEEKDHEFINYRKEVQNAEQKLIAENKISGIELY